MAIQPYAKFKAITDFNQTLLTEEIEYNLKEFTRWGLLYIGAWQDVQIPSSGYYGGTYHELTAIVDPQYEELQVWETPRKDLVYETGINNPDLAGHEPISISGVYVNNTFYGSGHATYGHYIDYTNGHVIFNTPLVDGDTVQMNYSYRTVSVEVADESPLWREIQYGSFRVDDSHRTDNSKGEWTAVPALRRQQLPAIIIEAVPRGTNRGWEIGSQTLEVSRDILFHIIAENRGIRNRLCDIIALEENQTIWLFNSDDLVGGTDWPLDYRGAKNSAGLIYPNLIEAHKWLRTRFDKTYVSEMQSITPDLHLGTVRLTTQTIITKD
jgi:hypothetical protein